MKRTSQRPHLSPHGTARQRFGQLRGEAQRQDELGAFFQRVARGARAHDLGDDTLYLAEELVRLASFLGERERRALSLAVLASIVAARQGSTRVPLGGGKTGYLGSIIASIARAAELDLDVSQVVRDIAALGRSVTFDQLIGSADEYRPLVVAEGHLYQQRMLECERAFATRLIDRLRAEAPAVDDAELSIALDAVAKSGPFELSDEQLAAVRRAATQPFTVITGGPGTGKTAIVLALLRALHRLGVPPGRIALAGPTGKSVNRLAQSMRTGLDAIEERPAEDDALLEQLPDPQTIHRLLGYAPHSDRFHHHDNNPLPADVIVVDESSMIDLTLMERLLRAIPAGARLVLLGDAEQLPSVDAGAVLRDLVDVVAEHTVVLTRSYRMDPTNPAGRAILELAGRINRGRPPVPLPPEVAGAVAFVDTKSDAARVAAFVDQWYRQRFCDRPELDRLTSRVYRVDDGAPVDADTPALDELFAHLERSRILTVTRRYPTGSEAINRRLHERVLEQSTLSGRAELYPGEPIMMTRNDYSRGLFNGDQGVVVRAIEDGQPQHFRAVFRKPGGYAVFHLDALRSHIELAFAMTVHKSQGSELDDVAVILPTRDLPLLSRELLYTAVTRARRAVTLVGSEPLFRIAANRTIERCSGVADRLRD